MKYVPPKFTKLSDMAAIDVGRLTEPEARTILEAIRFSFRWDERKTTDGQRTVEAIKGAEGKRLFYKEAVA